MSDPARPTLGEVTDALSAPVEQPQPRPWALGFALSATALLLLVLSIAVLFTRGIGIWGVNVPVAWGFAIVNFVFWIGIGHAGTLISAILLLLRAGYRTSVNRFAEAMTIVAVMCAGIFPILHLGRPQFFYWLVPYPSTMGVWPQFRSPLVWDIFAVLTYFTVSLIFWYVGLVPDLATLRDRTQGLRAKIYGVFALGWRGSARHWKRHQAAYLLLAGVATPLVVSVHSVVSMDFATTQLPGWHSTIFPPYFVAGAIFSGLAMVLTLLIPVRSWYGLERFITLSHLDSLARLTLASGWIVLYGYLVEAFNAWYSGDAFEGAMMRNRAFGPPAPFFWALIAFNGLVPQVFWWRRARRSLPVLFVAALLINLGMWGERFVIVVTSLERDFVPSSWGDYAPTVWDVATLAGSFGLFGTAMFLFVRYLPAIAMSETREDVHAGRL